MKTDILIVGAGVAGLSLAAMLSKSGLSITLIDPNPLLTSITDEYGLRASAINLASKHILMRAGVWNDIQACRHGVYRDMHVWNTSGEIHFTAAECGQDQLGYIIENQVLQTCLANRIQTQDHIQVIEKVKATRLTPLGDAVSVLLDNGERIKPRLIIGADGANSWVRQAFGIACVEKPYDHLAIVANVKTEKPHQFTAWQRFLSTGPLALLPMSDPNSCSIVWSQDSAVAQSLLEDDEETFNTKITQAFENKLGHISLASTRKAFPIVMRHAAHYVEPHVALVGDAAHTVHPLAGLGLNLGLQDVSLLAELINATPHRFAELSLLNTYSRQRRGENLKVSQTMSSLKWLFSGDQFCKNLIRNEALALVDHLPAIKSLFLTQAEMR
jgi:2-polyprenylphenol 6-hydroxylase